MQARDEPYRDEHGRTLQEYPRPSVAVDTAVLTVREDRLCLLVVGRDEDGWSLPGSFLHPGETLREAALRALADKTGVRGLNPQQLHVFDAPGRDDRGWVLSVAHVDAVRPDRIPARDHTALISVTTLPALRFDHAQIVRFAVERVRNDYAERPDPWQLLPPGEAIAMRDLRLLHEAVLGRRLVADTFRRAMLPWLRPTGESRRGRVGKPAELFMRR